MLIVLLYSQISEKHDETSINLTLLTTSRIMLHLMKSHDCVLNLLHKNL